MDLKKIKKKIADTDLFNNKYGFSLMKLNGFVIILTILMLYSCNNTEKHWTVNAKIEVAGIP